MAYFNHAFTKIFLGTGATRTAGSGGVPDPATAAAPASTGGFITTKNVTTSTLASLGVGYFGMFNPKTYLSMISTDVDTETCCPLMLISASVMLSDKIGPFAGGYQETNKSKVINPKFIRQFYRVDQCTPQQAVVNIGKTTYAETGTTASCCKTFLCGETYYLRIDVKGSPALRYLNHQAYQTLSAYTGCCATAAPDPVDSTLVFIEWAKAIVINQYLTPFLFPVVFDESGVAWYPPGTTVTLDGTSTPVADTQWWDAYVSPGHTEGACAGMRLYGAYVETTFNTCTFQVTDFFEKEPVQIYASEVDYNGDPCTFEGLCVLRDECKGVQGMGFGEQVLRDLVVSESYLQNYVNSNDFRVREITRGYDILDAVNRNALYTRYFILHSVPRYNNPTGTFDNDQYLLEIITNGTNAAFETFMDAWLDNCTDCTQLDTYDCVPCVIEPDTAP